MPLGLQYGMDQLAVSSLAASFVLHIPILLQMGKGVVPGRPPGESLHRWLGVYVGSSVCDHACKCACAQVNEWVGLFWSILDKESEPVSFPRKNTMGLTN